MSDPCGVQTCNDEGEHEVGLGGERLCLKHALAWDADEDARVGRVAAMTTSERTATMDEIWAEHFSRWCGEQA